MTKPPENDLSKTHPRSEPEDIQRARQDVNNAAAEHERAMLAAQVAGRKLQQAHEKLDALLKRPTHE